mmetsp:Transcript_4697/g.5102  ORF Transcript_4697/g.5102 Transcript_4697/m.5102 type:complete len:158 (-) Transcript_4697:49-522(-)
MGNAQTSNIRQRNNEHPRTAANKQKESIRSTAPGKIASDCPLWIHPTRTNDELILEIDGVKITVYPNIGFFEIACAIGEIYGFVTYQDDKLYIRQKGRGVEDAEEEVDDESPQVAHERKIESVLNAIKEGISFVTNSTHEGEYITRCGDKTHAFSVL